jgi:sugar phosphate isomerase/epimerase
VFVAASSRCFADKPFFEACQLVTDLEYDKIEVWMSGESSHLNPGETADAPEKFLSLYRESTRLTPIAITLEEDVQPKTLAGLSKLAKLMRIAQLTVPASPLGTPFNTEIDRLREFVKITGGDGVRLSIKTKTGHLTEDPRTAVELCQAVPGLGLTLDPSYYICGPCRGQSIDPSYPFVHHVHLRDTSPDQVQVQTGLGEVDYARLIAHLEKHRYKLALSVDLLPEYTDQNDRPLEMRKLKMLLDTLL